MNEDRGEERAGFLVVGAVQGVGFRFWAQRAGVELGLRGSVRNARDGSVELHVSGPRAAVTSFENRLRRGPAAARVERVERVESTLPIPTHGFVIEP